MKLLVIIVSNQFSPDYINNIQRLSLLLQSISDHIDYIGISSFDDFHHYENIITFKSKIINQYTQFTKICDFIQKNKEDLNSYDWFIKFRPEIFLFDNIPFDQLHKNCINARARRYYGPKKIKYGCSVGGKGPHSHIKDSKYYPHEYYIELDDQIYIFDKTVIDNGGFNLPLSNIIQHEHEPFHNNFWVSQNIDRNIIGINMCLMKNNTYSGDI